MSARAAGDRLGLAVQPCALRFLGFVPANLTAAPAEVVERLAKRVGVARPGLPTETRRRWTVRNVDRNHYRPCP
jgi:Domain of unknown function (DUF4158)